MKPRFEKMSYETTIMLEKAKAMNDRLNRIEKEMTLPLSAGTPRTSKRGKMESMRKPREGMREVGEMPLPGTGDDAGMDVAQKAEKDCPSCKDGKLDKAGMCKAGCVPSHKMAKAQPGFKPEKITDINPHFVAESGGQTKSGYFTTNGKTIETEDAKPKRKKADSKINMERLSSRQNPHSDTGVVREEKFD
tara:strand:- start:436 stop:1008 length:573 start_codon:yes stop_codon:yes gene_type:complete